MFNTIKQKARKLVSAIQRNKLAKKVIAVGAAVCVMAMSAVTCFAADGEPVSDIAPEQAATQIFEMFSQQLNFTTILAVLGVVIGAALAMVLGWWAIRKIAGALMTAFKKGKMKI